MYVQLGMIVGSSLVGFLVARNVISEFELSRNLAFTQSWISTRPAAPVAILSPIFNLLLRPSLVLLLSCSTHTGDFSAVMVTVEEAFALAAEMPMMPVSTRRIRVFFCIRLVPNFNAKIMRHHTHFD